MNQPGRAAQKATPALRVLLIDDHAIVLRAIRNLLEVDGHLVSAGASGLAGVGMFEDALAQGTPFDVVITDFGMPGMDGGDVARRVKLAHPPTWVVMLTGGGPAVEASDGWKRHVDVFLGKPPRLADLRRVLGGARGR
ncbi:MAG: hybrid sensor histidine kinase/response regulator [Ramlibacter sp.]|nr:hybrid sensor histidine kinase/response regulator [Ramlibacter sp.]